MIEKSLPIDWNIQSISGLNVGGFSNCKPFDFPEDIFEYYSIPAYQDNLKPTMTKGSKILSQKLLIPPRCVLFGKLNPRVLKVWNVKRISDARCIASTEWLPIVPTPEIDADFIYFLMLSSWVAPIAKRLASGSTPSRQRVEPKAFYNIPVPVPPLNEQQDIANILRAIEQAEQFQENYIKCLRKLKRITMQVLFSCGLNGRAKKETKIGEVPENWDIVQVGDIFNINQGLSLKGNLSDSNTGVPFLRTSNIFWGHVKLDNISRMNIDERSATGKELADGDLLVCEGGDIGRAAVWNNEIGNCTYQNHLHRLRPKEIGNIKPKFAMSWLEEGFRYRLVYEGAANRTTIPNLSRSGLANLSMPMPPIEEQQQIVTILDTIDRQINLHKKKRVVLRKIFKVMLHKLMTGEIRTADLNISRNSSVSEETMP